MISVIPDGGGTLATVSGGMLEREAMDIGGKFNGWSANSQTYGPGSVFRYRGSSSNSVGYGIQSALDTKCPATHDDNRNLASSKENTLYAAVFATTRRCPSHSTKADPEC
jgi:hypothetical protein